MSGPYPKGEIRLDDVGGLDDLVAEGVKFFHLERMDEGAWWMQLHLADGSSIVVWLTTARPASTKITGRAERESAPPPGVSS